MNPFLKDGIHLPIVALMVIVSIHKHILKNQIKKLDYRNYKPNVHLSEVPLT